MCYLKTLRLIQQSTTEYLPLTFNQRDQKVQSFLCQDHHVIDTSQLINTNKNAYKIERKGGAT